MTKFRVLNGRSIPLSQKQIQHQSEFAIQQMKKKLINYIIKSELDPQNYDLESLDTSSPDAYAASIYDNLGYDYLKLDPPTILWRDVEDKKSTLPKITYPTRLRIPTFKLQTFKIQKFHIKRFRFR